MKEVLSDVYEFLLSLLILLGGGFLLLNNVAVEFASGLMSLVVGFWFQKRSSENAVNNLLRQSPTLVPIQNENHVTPMQVILDSESNPVNQP